jgi:hypothetical protein
MEGGRMTKEAPISQVWKWKKDWKRVLLMKSGCQSVVYLQDKVKPAQNKTQDRYTSLISKGELARNLAVTLLSQYCRRTDIYISNVKY